MGGALFAALLQFAGEGEEPWGPPICCKVGALVALFSLRLCMMPLCTLSCRCRLPGAFALKHSMFADHSSLLPPSRFNRQAVNHVAIGADDVDAICRFYCKASPGFATSGGRQALLSSVLACTQVYCATACYSIL